MDSLKSCPFCGEGKDLIVQHHEGTIIHPAYRIYCGNCGASNGYSDRVDPVKNWNSRAALQSQKPEPNNMMLSAVIRMPFEMAMADPISRMQFYQRAQQALDELEAMQSQDREDAERYRWLRDGGNDDMGVVRGFDCIDCGSTTVAGTYEEALDGEQLDAAIDHARRVEGEGE